MIEFQILRYKNILSTGNAFTEIKLDKSANTLIVGENGAGKSTILDALCFVLYGKPFRKIKKDQIINSINQKDCMVEIEFRAYNRAYKIRRGIKPNVFEIYTDGVLVDQTAALRDYQEILEKNILRMNMKSFTQIVILGSSSFVPFMQLNAATRREVIEDLLDIRIFSTMASLLKEKMVFVKEAITLNDHRISSAKNLVKVQESHIKRMSLDTDKVRHGALDKIESAKARHLEATLALEDELRKQDALLASISDHDAVKQKKTQIEQIESGLESKKRNANKAIKFYTDTNTCPTCVQRISADIKHTHIEDKLKAVGEVDDALVTLAEKITKLNDRLEEIAGIVPKIAESQRFERELNRRTKDDELEIKLLNEQINSLTNESSVEVQATIDKLNDDLAEYAKEQENHSVIRETYDIAGVILRDTGIKARIIKQYVPVINALVNKYLAVLEFFVKFELNEQFEEKILSRHRDDFTYDSFSEGERMRIDLALLFTWRTVARMKNSASTNLLILDEVFDASLDASGCDEFLKLIHNLENSNVFVISHKGDVLADKFRSTIKFEKFNNFSRMA